MFESDRMADIFGRLGEPVFLARHAERDGHHEITLHTMDRKSATRLGLRVRDALRREGADAICRVVAHNPRALRRVRSLETLASRFGEGRVVYDPTGFVARSQAVTDCARRLRSSLGEAVQNVFLDTSRRTLYVIVQESAVAERADLVRRAGAIMGEWQQSVDPRFALAVRIGTEPPRGLRLVSVDARSATQTIGRQLIQRKGWIRGAIAVGAAALFGAAVTVPAVADPAVSKTNGSIFVRGGAYDEVGSDSHGEGELLGKVTFPIGQSFGGQAEAAVGTEEYYGFGGHLFYRNPSWVMAGAFVSFDDTNGVEMTRYGAEADFYFGQFTAGGRIGQQEGDAGEGTFGSVDVSFYLNPNLAFRGGVEFEPDDGRDTIGRVGFEWQPAMDSSPGLSVFADGEWGDDYDHIRAGLKIHFGTDGMTMMDRERKADPKEATGNRRGGYGEYGYTPPA